MSLVEKALQKAQALNRTRQPPLTTEPIVVGRVVAHDHAAPLADGADMHWHSGVKPNRTVHVDRVALRAAGLLPTEDQERELADQYRTIKRPLIRSAFGAAPPGPSPQLIMATSALPGDGKTFTCVNLALSMSLEKDHIILLVDGDVAKRHVSHVFGVDREPGLLDVLADPTLDVESVIVPTDIQRLSILPAGSRSETATELLASARMEQIMARLSSISRRGIVVIDSPPILLTSEARVLTNLVGQVVLVVKAGQTPQQAVKDTIDIIGPGKNVRLVLNQVDLRGPLGYYYGYRYGYEASTPSANTAAGEQK